jgi:sarcosine oxidase
MARFEVIVIGLGAVGSAAACELAKAGRRVLGFDACEPPHIYGSSHGETRVTRAAIGEGPEFSPLAIRSLELWRESERQTGAKLLVQCGCLSIRGQGMLHGVPDFFENVERAAQLYGVPCETFASGAEISRRFPAFQVQPSDAGLLDLWGGYVFPEQCIRTQLALAKAHGAQLQGNTKAVDFEPVSNGGIRVAVEITVDLPGTVRQWSTPTYYEADQVLVTAGAWLPGLIGDAVAPHLKVTRQVLHWFEIGSNPERFGPGFPVFIWDVTGRHGAQSVIYGFPYIGSPAAGVKIAEELESAPVDPDSVSRAVSPQEIDDMYGTYIAPFVPDLGPRSLRTEVCLYTRQKTGRFIIDRHPDEPAIYFASACSGHGFKHSAAVGEAIAQEMSGQSASLDLGAFRLNRLQVPSASDDL